MGPESGTLGQMPQLGGRIGVRPQWEKVWGGSCYGKLAGSFPVGSGHSSLPFSAAVTFRLRPWRYVFRTWFIAGFGGSAR
ncbi:hypothetical protein STPYR_10201 [uncultured Stenotrophomonas sp.]|uniref:Uncharacterized protein n=1 Tax=uncultured Stenotrophomonas sp. TaxID=165438 RepID=A0A1Y5PZ56_9GAMM|nr:hypothetical protein STPYR_10201 [uncultured Stenotrophomonas sp.]